MDTSATRPRTARRFTLLDGMILVAATACGCAVDGWLNSLIEAQGGLDTLDIFGSLLGARQYPELAVLALLMILPVAAAWTLALIPLWLIKPRPGLRQLARRPGWIACCSFAVALAFATVAFGGLAAIIPPSQALGLLELTPILPLFLSPAILTAWLTLILGRRWRGEPSWLDRSGRALGLFWVLMAVIGPVIVGLAFL